MYHEVGCAFDFMLTYFSTYGGVWLQAFSSQDVSMNYILHKGEIHQVGAVTEENKERELNSSTAVCGPLPRYNL